MAELYIMTVSFYPSLGAPELKGEVVPKGELDAIVVVDPAVRKVVTAAPYELATRHYIVNWVIQEVGKAIHAAAERIGNLQGGVGHIE